MGGWARFWFLPSSPTPLHIVRILTGLLCLLWLLPLAGHFDTFFGLNGWLDRQALGELDEMYRRFEERSAGGVPQGGWGIQYLAGTNSTALSIIYWASIGTLLLFTAGVFTRITAVLTWVIVVSFTSNVALEYDADAYLAIFAFYLMLGYLFLGQMHGGLSWWERILGSNKSLLLGRRTEGAASGSVAANLAMRLLQVHIAILFVTTGLHKLQYGDWWQGLSLWYPLYPPGTTSVAQSREHVADRASFLFAISLGAYLILAWQIGLPLFAWRRRWSQEVPEEGATPLQRALAWMIGPRTILLGGAFFGCLGLMFLYQLPLLGPALIIACLSFITAEEWDKVFALLGRVPGLERLAAPATGTVGAAHLSAAEGRHNLVTAGRN
jgi:hypothetical protein